MPQPRLPSSSPFIWGLSFVVIKLGVVDHAAAAARRAAVHLRGPPRRSSSCRGPKTRWRYLVGYGFFLGVAQFGLLFAAIALGMPASLASLVMQAQVFFTILFAALLMGERPGPHQVARWRSSPASA